MRLLVGSARALSRSRTEEGGAAIYPYIRMEGDWGGHGSQCLTSGHQPPAPRPVTNCCERQATAQSYGMATAFRGAVRHLGAAGIWIVCWLGVAACGDAG